jgi:hypothetical protein
VLPTPGKNFQSVRPKYSGSRGKTGSICKLHLLADSQLLFSYLKHKKKAFRTNSQFFSSIKSGAAFVEREDHIFKRFHPRKILRNRSHPPAQLRISLTFKI